jgi:hypothetical protein
MTSRVVTIEELFLAGAYAPAAVQRDYQWRQIHCRTLLADLDRVFAASSFARPEADPAADIEREADADRVELELPSEGAGPPPLPLDHYMLGAIVVTPAERGPRLVYDGLQRLTTLTIFAAVLRDLSEAEPVRTRLDAIIRLAPDAYRVTLAGRDTTLARQIQPAGEAIKFRRAAAGSDMGGRIRAAATVFREGVKSWSAARRDAFTEFLLSQVRVVLVEAHDPRLARQIFVTTNMRGKNLDRVDLLKGQIVDIADNEETANQIVAHWNGARNASGDDFESLLTALDFIERQAPQGDDCLNALAEHLLAKRGPRGIEGWVQKLTHYAGDYKALSEFKAVPPATEFAANVWRLRLFRWDNWEPLALLWLSDWRRAMRQGGPGAASKLQAATRRFSALHRRCMAVTLAGFSHSDRERIFGRAIAQVNRGLNPLASTGALAFNAGQITRIGETLRLPVTDKDVRSTLIRWLDSMAYAEAIPDRVRTTTVEHILPRRPAETSEWAQNFPDAESRYLACHALGNLAGLDKDRNEALRNAEYAAKTAVYATAAADYPGLADLASIPTWNDAAIEARTERLARRVEELLDLPPAFAGPPSRGRA